MDKEERRQRMEKARQEYEREAVKLLMELEAG
jgi:hypothetical protein